MAQVLQVKEEPASVTRETRLATPSAARSAEPRATLTLEQVANDPDEHKRHSLISAYMLQLSKRGRMDCNDVVRDANLLRKLIRSDNHQVQAKVAELLVQYLKLMKLNTQYDAKLGGIQDATLLLKLYQVLHDDTCHYLLPNGKAGETVNKFLCSLISTSSSEHVFAAVVKLFQRTVDDVLAKYQTDSPATTEKSISTEHARLVIGVMKTLLTLTKAFGSPPAPRELLCALSVNVINATKAHLCRLYSYNLVAFLIKDIADKDTLDSLLCGLSTAQFNQVTALVKETNSLNNTCNWKFKYARDGAARESSPQGQPETPSAPADGLNQGPSRKRPLEAAVEAAASGQTSKAAADPKRKRTLETAVAAAVSGNTTKPAADPKRKRATEPETPSVSSDGRDQRPTRKRPLETPAAAASLGKTSTTKAGTDLKRARTHETELPNNWYRDLLSTFEANRGEGKAAVVDKNAWKGKNDALLKTLATLEPLEHVDIEAVATQLVTVLENLLKYESAIPVVINSLNLFAMLQAKSNFDFLSASKSHLLADLLVEKLKETNKKVRDACVLALIEAVKHCKLQVVADAAKKALANVSPTCRENMCNFLNGKLIINADGDFYHYLKQLLAIMADHVKQMFPDRVPKVRQSLAALRDVIQDFNLVYTNEGTYAITSTSVMTNSTIYRSTITTSRASPPARQSPPARHSPPAGQSPPQPPREAPRAQPEPQPLAKPTPAKQPAYEPETTVVTPTPEPAPQHASVTRTEPKESVAEPRAEPVSATRTEPKESVAQPPEERPKTSMFVENLVDVVDPEVLDKFRAHDKRGLDEALYTLCLWMTDNPRVVRSVQYYLLGLANEFYPYFTNGVTLDMFFRALLAHTLPDDAFAELLELMKNHQDPRVLNCVLAPNNANTNRLLNPLNSLYYAPAGAKTLSTGASGAASNANAALPFLVDFLGKFAADGSYALSDEVLAKLVSFLSYFVKVRADYCARAALDQLWALDQKYKLAAQLEQPLVTALRLSRPSKTLAAAYSAAALRLEKYVSRDLFMCMFQANQDNKKR